MPNININFPLKNSASDKERIANLESYIQLLTEKITYCLGNLDTDNVTSDVSFLENDADGNNKYDIQLAETSALIDSVSTEVEQVAGIVSAHIGSVGESHGTASETENGFLSAADKTKIDGIEAFTAEAIATAISGKEDAANKNVANGYCGLDENANVLPDNLPTASEAALGGIKIGYGLEIETDGTLNVNPTGQITIAKLMQDISDGTAVSIDCRGDSTYYGYVPGGSRLTTPAPAMLQIMLRKYYNNTAATVNNLGITGNQTTNALRTWATDIANSTAKIIYFNYGINDACGNNPSGVSDPAITAEQFRTNLISMVKIVRINGKIAVLETSNPLLPVGASTDYTRSKKVKEFALVTRQVAQEMNVPLVDSYAWCERYFSAGSNNSTSLPDGVHPSQDLSNYKAMVMLSALIPFNVLNSSFDYITCLNGGTRMYNPGYGTGFVSESSRKFKYNIYAQKILIPFCVENNGTDVYLAVGSNDAAEQNISITLNNTAVATFNGRVAMNLSRVAAEQEMLIGENLTAGYYIAEINCPSAYMIYYYVRSRETKYKILSRGDTNANYKSLVLTDYQYTIATTGVRAHTMLDVPTSRLIKNLEIEVTAKFDAISGFVLFCHEIDESGINGAFVMRQGGVNIYVNGSGNLTVAEGNGNDSYANTVVLGSTDLRGAYHTYKAVVTTAGVVSCYVDDVLIGTFTMSFQYYGGFLGFFRYNSGTSYISKVLIN